jgi:hypothetical protein
VQLGQTTSLDTPIAAAISMILLLSTLIARKQGELVVFIQQLTTNYLLSGQSKITNLFVTNFTQQGKK